VEALEPIVFFICPICFLVFETEQERLEHRLATGHPVFACKPGKQGDERRKPVNNSYGQYVSRAPRWYLEALGWLVVDDD
jgi:hypothetical protein